MGGECVNQSNSTFVAGVIISHIEKVRSLPGFKRSLAVIIIESNLPVIAGDVLLEIKKIQSHTNLGDIIFMNENDSKDSGLRLSGAVGSKTTKFNKPLMFKELTNQLQNRTILLYKKFIVSQEEFSTCGDIKEEFISELRNFKKEIVFPKNQTNDFETKVIYYGKSKNGDNDDFVMALGIIVLMAKYFITKDKYIPYRKR